MMVGAIGHQEEFLAVAFYMESEMAWCVAIGFDGFNAGDHLIAWFDKSEFFF